MSVAFAVGTLVPVGTLLLVVPLLGASGFFVGGSIARALATLGVACLAGGQFAGGALRRGVRSRLAFGVAFPIGLAIPLVVVSGLAALSGREGFTELGLFVPGFVLAYGLLGAVGSALSGDGWRRTARTGGAFAAGGLCGGVALAGVAALVAGSSSGAAMVAHTVGAAVACLVPTALGGWWLGRRAAERGNTS